MIYKDLDPYSGGNEYEAAGRKAGEQMASLLNRFRESPDVDVLNGLHFDVRGVALRIDHLILLPGGLLIVESDSLSGKTQVQEDGQWLRWQGSLSQAMPSPITMARKQALLLKELLSQAVRQKGAFDAIPVEVQVALPDNVQVLWPMSGPLPEVCKADLIPDRIQALAARGGPLNQDNRRKIAEFLRLAHKPAVVAPAPAPVQPQAAMVVMVKGSYPEKRCKHCQSIKLEIQDGPEGFQFNCGVCDRNSSLIFTCPECGGEGRIRKDGNTFYAECNACSASKLFFTNL
jgi:hypothetical protein